MRLMGAPHGIVILQGWRFRPCLSWIPSKYGKTCMASSSGNESMHFWCYLVLIFLHRDAVAAARRSVSSSSEMRRWTATGTIFLQHAVTEGKAFGFGCALSTVSFYRKYDGKDSFTSIFHIRTSPLQMMTSIWRQILVLLTEYEWRTDTNDGTPV